MTDIDIVRELLRRAVLTLAVVEDPERRYRIIFKSPWPPIRQDVRDAYGSAPPKARIFDASPADVSRYLEVLDWLRWYKQAYPLRGPETVKLFKAELRGIHIEVLRDLCTTNRIGQRASKRTVKNRIKGMLRSIAIHFKDDILLYRIDGFPEFPYQSAIPEQWSECVEDDLPDLPRSPKAWISAIPEPLSPKDEARAHKLLNKRLQRNHLAAMQRKRTKTPAHALLAAVRC